MRKLLIALICCAMIAALASCGNASGDENNKIPGIGNLEAKANQNAVKVDKGLLNTEITLPSLYAEYQGYDYDPEWLYEDGDFWIEVFFAEYDFKINGLNSDDTLSVTMATADYNKMMANLQGTLETILNDMVTNDMTYFVVESITADDNFRNIVVEVDSSVHDGYSEVMYNLFLDLWADDEMFEDELDELSEEIFDTIWYNSYARDIGSVVILYQMLSGQKTHTNIEFRDIESGKLVATYSTPYR